MTINPDLIAVLEYITRQDEEKAKMLLKQVIIQKARAIHEELMSMDESNMDETDMDEADMDETVGGSGDLGADLTDDIESMEDEINFEETMSEDELDELMKGDGEELDVDGETELEIDDQDGDVSMDGEIEGTENEVDTGDIESLEKPMDMMDAAMRELRAEFLRIQGGKDTTDGAMDDKSSEMDSADGGMPDEMPPKMPEKMDESDEEDFEFDEDFDELAESLDLEVIERNMEKSQKTPQDAGSASSGMSVGKDAVSPVPKSQTSRMGAKPVETGKGPTENGFNLKSAPKSADMGLGDNRRKKSTDGASKVSKEGQGSALLNKTTSDGFGAINNTSPLSKGGQNLK